MLSKFIKIVILISLLGVLALVVGPCVYYTFIDKPVTGGPELPCKEDAAYSIYIENSGGLLLTDDYEQHGQDIGSRIFVVNGYWEISGNEFKFKQGVVILDESVFGEITVKKRTKD
jgi:hypothetical protein